MHFGLLCIAKYLYQENSAANPNLKKMLHFQSPDFGIKKALDVFQNNPKICFLGEKSSKLTTL
jgi:hypothetical protein